MGILVLSSDGQTRTLQSEQTFGRTESCEVRLTGTHVSSNHAELRWFADGWHVKDLGSLNGTFVNGRRAPAGEWVLLDQGAKLAFGNPGDPPWVLQSADAPIPTLVPLEGGEPVPIAEGIIGIPVDAPVATVSVDTDGKWWLEDASGDPVALQHKAQFEVAGRLWRLSAPPVPSLTTPLGLSFTIDDTLLRIGHSADEENIQVEAVSRGHAVSLGARLHHFLLLVLARKRLQDRERGILESSCGWIYQDELLGQLRIDRVNLNLQVHRIRRQFSTCGFTDPSAVIERRPQTRELRIGFAAFDIQRS